MYTGSRHSLFILISVDPVKAERFQDEMMRSRERMQHRLDIETQSYMSKQEEVCTYIDHVPYAQALYT